VDVLCIYTIIITVVFGSGLLPIQKPKLSQYEQTIRQAASSCLIIGVKCLTREIGHGFVTES